MFKKMHGQYNFCLLYTSTTTTQPLALATVASDGTPSYRLATQVINGETVLLKDAFVKSINIDNVWQAQLGIRYTFN